MTGKLVSFSTIGTGATRLILVLVAKNRDFEIFYDAPVKPVWRLAGPAQKDGRRRISSSKNKDI